MSTTMIGRTATLVLILVAGGVTLAGCSSTPADRSHICGEYDTLSHEAMDANGFFDNDVFDSAGQLADLASRYQGSPDLGQDASELHAIAKSDSTNLFALGEATDNIGELCDSSFSSAGLGISNSGTDGLSGDAAGGLNGSTGSGDSGNTGDSGGLGDSDGSDGSTDSQDTPDESTPDTQDPTDTTDTTDSAVPPTDDAAALAALQQTAAQDKPAVDALADQWVPQLSSKADGTVADGITYDDMAIWQKYQQLAAQYPQALLLWSADYSSFTYSDYWVVIMPEPSASGAQANSWCDGQSLPADQCYAKLISHTAGPKGSSVTR